MKTTNPSSRKRKRSVPGSDVHKTHKVVKPLPENEPVTLDATINVRLRALLPNGLPGTHQEAVGSLLQRHDVSLISPPSAGTATILSFLAPTISHLASSRFRQRHGAGVIVLVPTREAAIEVSSIASDLVTGTTLTVGTVVEGANKGSEETKLEKGVNIIAGTPKRLLDHLRGTTSFVIKNIKALVVYGADEYEHLGLKKDMRECVKFLEKEGRVTAVCAATETDGVKAVVELACNAQTLRRFSVEGKGKRQRKGKQGYVLMQPENRLLLLLSFVKKFQHKKVVVYCSSTSSAIFHSEVANMLDIPSLVIHGKEVKANAKALAEFAAADKGILFTSLPAVLARIPSADWLIEFDPPKSTQSFLSTPEIPGARSVLFLQPQEKAFVDGVTEAGLEAEEFEFLKNALLKVWPIIQKAVAKNFLLRGQAKEAFRVFLQEYNIHSQPEIFDSTKLDVTKLARSYGFEVPPRVQLREVAEKKVDLFKRPYGPEKVRAGKRQKA